MDRSLSHLIGTIGVQIDLAERFHEIPVSWVESGIAGVLRGAGPRAITTRSEARSRHRRPRLGGRSRHRDTHCSATNAANAALSRRRYGEPVDQLLKLQPLVVWATGLLS